MYVFSNPLHMTCQCHLHEEGFAGDYVLICRIYFCSLQHLGVGWLGLSELPPDIQAAQGNVLLSNRQGGDGCDGLELAMPQGQYLEDGRRHLYL